MGMFDNIKCKKELPLTEELKNLNVKWNEIQFQTKDLDNCLSEYIISEGGELFEEVKEYDYVYYTEEEKKSKTHKPWNFIKEQILKNEYQTKIDFHGKITFYEIFEYSNEEDLWVDFSAYFIYGKLDKIELVKIEKVKSRKFNLDEFFEKQKNKKNSFLFKFKKYSGMIFLIKTLNTILYRMYIFFYRLYTFTLKIL